MHETEFLIIAGLFLAFGLISRRIQGSVLTGPMLFAGLGLVLGPAVLGLVNIEITNSVLHTLAEITLVLVLFSDAASIDLRQLRRDHNLPLRMLLIGMPLTIAFGADWASHARIRSQFRHPARPGDRVTVTGEVKSVTVEDGRTRVRCVVECRIQDGNVVAAGDASLLV